MVNGEGMSAEVGALGWGAAYTSNDAYDVLQDAQARLDKLNEITALSMEGVTVEEAAVEQAVGEVERAQRDFEALSAMAGVIAMMDNSPMAPITMSEAKQPKPTRHKTTKSDPEGPKPAAKPTESKIAPESSRTWMMS